MRLTREKKENGEERERPERTRKRETERKKARNFITHSG